MKKNNKFSIVKFLSNAWFDLKFKLIIVGSVFIGIILVVILVVTDMDNDKKMYASKANKYETYIDQLLLQKFSIDELKEMNEDQLKLAVDMVIDTESNKVSNAPSLKDFILPVKDDDFSLKFKLTRKPKKQWSQEDIDQYWVDLETLDLDKLEENNFDYLKARLQDIR